MAAKVSALETHKQTFMKKIKKNKLFILLAVITSVVLKTNNTLLASDGMNAEKENRIIQNRQYALNYFTELSISRDIEEAFSRIREDLNQKLQNANQSKNQSRKLPKIISLNRGHPGLLVLDIESELNNFCFSYLDEIKSYFENSNVVGIYIRLRNHNSFIYEIYLPVKADSVSNMKNSVILTEHFYDTFRSSIENNPNSFFVKMMINSGQLKKEFSELKMNYEKHIKMIDEILMVC